MKISKDSNTDIFLIGDKNIMCTQSRDDFTMEFNPEAKYSKFIFYSKVSIFRYVENKDTPKIILSINSKTHKNIHFIFYKETLKEKGFNTLKQLLNDHIFLKSFKEIIMKENTENVFNDAIDFLNEF